MQAFRRISATIFLTISTIHGFSQPISTIPDPVLDVLHYSFHIMIHDHTNEIIGETDALLQFTKSGQSSFYLHLAGIDSSGHSGMKVDEVYFNDKSVSFEHTNHRLTIQLSEPTEVQQQGTVKIQYRGIPADGLIISENKYGDRTFFGDNWPNRAHYWLPTNDHPADKATCEFIITAPDHYEVIANGTKREESTLPPNASDKYRYKRTHWAITQPIPTKVMVFGAARFAIQYYQSIELTEVEHWLYPEDRDEGFEKFSPTADILTYYRKTFGPYPYEKLANVQSKTQYGGMENASAIFYNERAITNQPSIEGLIAHEIAHQWFGNAVTEKAWSDVWLSEGFSTYLTHLYFEHTYGKDSLESRLKNDQNRIFAFHLKSPQSKVVETNESNLFQLLNANTYQKGSWVLHMLRFKVGDDNFFSILRQYYSQYQHKNASTQDFIALACEVSGQDLTNFFSQWLTRSDHPVLKGTWKYSGIGKKVTIDLEQVQDGAPYHTQLQFGIRYDKISQPEVHTVVLSEQTHTFTFKVKGNVRDVQIDPNTWLLQENTFTEK